MKLKEIKIFYIFCVIFFFFIITNSYASEKKEGIQNFPTSYRPYLQEILKNHPNWSFTALYTNLDWNTVINNENVFGKNLVPKSYLDAWKNTKQGEYNVEVDSGWVDSSRQAVEYCMDPRNFLYEGRLFQFEALSYDARTSNLNGIEKILYGTEFYNKIVEYKNSSGTNIVTDKKYSDLILDAAITSKVSPYHLASRVKQEVGPFLSHSSISGTVSGYEGHYNFYNIGATSSAEAMGAIKKGLQYAKDGNGASQGTKDKFYIPWNTKAKAMTGGGVFIGSSYINVGQNNIYLQKFDVNDEKTGGLYWHQYMTNVLAPYSESKIIYTGYNNSALLDSSMSFTIPVYNNMPEIPADSPNINEKDFTNSNIKVKANVSGTLNIRSGPSTSYDLVASVPKDTKMTIIKKGKQSGDLWDKVKLDNGLIGYAFHNYLMETPDIQITGIEVTVEKDTINKSESVTINTKITPEEAKNNKLIYKSSNTNVAFVDTTGKITGVSSGIADITVSSENGAVSKTVKITIYTPVTDVAINSGDIRLREGETFKVSSIVEPEDSTNKNVSWESSSIEVANIDMDGNILALKEGKTTIKVTTQDGNKEKSLELTVVPNLLGTEIIFDPSLKITGSQITGLDYLDVTVATMKKNINTGHIVEIYNSKNELLEDNMNIGTGAKIVFKNANADIVDEYNVVLYGDVNGDGKINTVDLLALQRHILKLQKLDGLFLKSANVMKTGKNPSSVDSLKIQRHILKLEIIKQ